MLLSSDLSNSFNIFSSIIIRIVCTLGTSSFLRLTTFGSVLSVMTKKLDKIYRINNLLFAYVKIVFAESCI